MYRWSQCQLYHSVERLGKNGSVQHWEYWRVVYKWRVRLEEQRQYLLWLNVKEQDRSENTVGFRHSRQLVRHACLRRHAISRTIMISIIRVGEEKYNTQPIEVTMQFSSFLCSCVSVCFSLKSVYWYTQTRDVDDEKMKILFLLSLSLLLFLSFFFRLHKDKGKETRCTIIEMFDGLLSAIMRVELTSSFLSLPISFPFLFVVVVAVFFWQTSLCLFCFITIDLFLYMMEDIRLAVSFASSLALSLFCFVCSSLMIFHRS